MSKAKKYYVVWKGRIPGIYQSWAEALDQVDKFDGAVYKGFENLDSAREAYENDFRKYVGTRSMAGVTHSGAKSSPGQPIKDAIAVDAACSGNPGPMEYQGVFVKTGQRLFHQGPFEQGTNNVGEFLALVHALAFCKKNNINCPIYTDSANAMIWINQKKAKTKLFKTAKNEIIFDLIERAEYWLKNNTIENEILKWETQFWGEIPADFGRK